MTFAASAAMNHVLLRATFGLALLLLALGVCSSPACAGGGSSNVAVVVNAESWASLTIANEYIALREIPAANVVYLTNVPGFETVDIETFRQRVLMPALQALEQRKLAGQIDYLVYSADFPYAVDVSKDVGNTSLPKVVTKIGSLTGLTYLCQTVSGGHIQYLDLNSNRYYRPPDVAVAGAEFATDQAAIKKNADAIKLGEAGKVQEALALFHELADAYPKSMLTAYNLACCEARLDHKDLALVHLQRAVELGWWNAQHTLSDPDLKSLHENKEFKSLIEKMEARVIDVAPTHGFRTMYAWDEKFQLVPPNRGIRYLISSMLGATSGRGTSVNEALESLRRAKAADATHPTGTIYYMANDNIRAETRAWAFRSAVDLLKKEGVAAEIIDNKQILPRNKRSIAGLMAGYASFDFRNWGSTIIPGAFCEHLTSYGGVLKQGAEQMPLTEWIARGATSSSGAVTEPYAVQWKFPTPYVHVHYARGSTLGEAYYQSVQMPYQLLLVGDPLCAPWLTRPQFDMHGLTEGQTVSGRIKLSPRPAAGQKLKQFEFYLDGRMIAIIKPEGLFEFDTTNVIDGRHKLTVVAVEDTQIEQQGSQAFNINIANGQHRATLQVANAVAYGEDVKVTASAAGATEIFILQNGRPLGKIEGAEGSLTFLSSVLGMGPVELVALASFGDKPEDRVISAPASLNVVAPVSEIGIAQPKGELVPGVLVTNAAGKSQVVPGLGKPDWQANTEVGSEGFEIETYLTLDDDDLYQLEFRSDSPVVMKLDDKLITREAGDGGDGRWLYAPLRLRRGWHKLTISVKPRENEPKAGDKSAFTGRIDLRFGNHGTESLNAHYCRTHDPK